MKMTMLGTGNALATDCYNTCFVLEENEEYLLVDGGGGNRILQQLKAAGIEFWKIRHVFITHKHVDHILGIVWMVRMFGQFMRDRESDWDVTLYGNAEVMQLLEQICVGLIEGKATQYLHDRIRLVTVKDGERYQILQREVEFFDIHSCKAMQFGFRMEYEPNRYLTCLGDEKYNDTEENYVRNADWLLHEAFCLYEEAERFRPYEKGHSTVLDACRLAQRMGVKNLLLYHTEDSDIPHRKSRYLAEGRRVYTGSLYVPDDLEVLELK